MFTLKLPDMTRAFRLEIGREGSRLALLEEGREISSREWPEARDMGHQLFEVIDSLLKEADIVPTEVTDFNIETDILESFTSVRIAQSVAKAWEYGAGSL
jgi:tRNA A37 threonylcarbamoyladenosine modification protein TsaB